MLLKSRNFSRFRGIVMEEIQKFYGTGRRKSAVARVYLRPGEGKWIINNRDGDEYFSRPVLMMVMREPFDLTETVGRYDVLVNVKGGGKAGQAGAVRHGISRALLKISEEMRPVLKKAGMLTRDSRVVERKKYGQPGARKRYQYSKR